METKTCRTCKRDLPNTHEYFAQRRINKQGVQILQGICKSCHKVYKDTHYKDHKQKYIDQAHNYRDKVREWFTELKKTLKCEKCGEDRYWVLDFHHFMKDKESCVSTLINDCSKKKILAEIKKCRVLCANCHRDIHHFSIMKMRMKH